MMSDYSVELANDTGDEFFVNFQGPKETIYEGGFWKIHITLPTQYPFRSPSVGFINKIFHPNVDFRSGTICLDVINQTWSPMYDLVNIFDVFLPQLLAYPNPEDPLNNEAAALLLENGEKYKEKVHELVQIYAKENLTKDSFNINKNPANDDTPVKKSNKSSVSGMTMRNATSHTSVSVAASSQSQSVSLSLNSNSTTQTGSIGITVSEDDEEMDEEDDSQHILQLEFQQTFDLEI